MKISGLRFLHKLFLVGSMLMFCLFGISGCGGSGEQKSSNKTLASTDKKPQVVSESEHQKFEAKYIEKCITSQHKDLSSDFSNDQELKKVCGCMAKEISKRISKADAIHFLQRNEFPFDLVMMTNAAANVCLTNAK